MGRFVRLAVAALVVVCLAAFQPPMASGAARTRPPQRKLHSELLRLYSARTIDARAEARRDITINRGMVAVSAVPQTDTATLLRDLRKIGLTDPARTPGMVGGYLPVSAIRAAERTKSLRYMRPEWVETGNVVADQGDVAQHSDLARTGLGLDGTGVTVGVISDTYNCLNGAATDISNDELPATSTVQEEGPCSPGTDEGRAMMQIVHDVAPGASAIFQTGYPTRAHMAQGIKDLRANGAQIIVDDIFYPTEPWFQDGLLPQAVDSVTASGATYFTLAGNFARRSYEAPFRDSGVLGVAGGTAHDFDPGPAVDTRQSVTIPTTPSMFFTLQWPDPDGPQSAVAGVHPKTDLDIHFFFQGNEFASQTTDNINTSLEPVEIQNIFNNGGPATIEIEIDLMAGPKPKVIKWLPSGAAPTATEYATNSSTAFGHSNARTALTVGAAAFYDTPAFSGPDPALLEPFSSAGGLKVFFNANGRRFRKPQTRRTPDFTAPDGANTSFFGSDAAQDADALPNFFGTSAAGPHAAAAAALGLQKVPNAKWYDFCNAFSSTAHDMGIAGYDKDTGSGLIDVLLALGRLKARSYGPCRKRPRRR